MNVFIREQGQASVSAAIAAAAVGLATFDGLGFPTSTGLMFLVIGLAGALWRLVQEAQVRQRSDDAAEDTTNPGSRHTSRANT